MRSLFFRSNSELMFTESCSMSTQSVLVGQLLLILPEDSAHSVNPAGVLILLVSLE